MFVLVWSSCERKPDHTEKTHLSNMVTTLVNLILFWTYNQLY